MGDVAYTWWHGGKYSPVMRDAMAEWQQLAEAEAIPFTVTQGGWNAGGVLASAGTHDGDAVDLRTRGLTRNQVTRLIELGRMIGMAAWLRTGSSPKWGVPAHGFSSDHIHAVPNGWGSPSKGARNQADAYRRGRDGLAGNRADAGPGHTSAYRNRTWHDYLTIKEALMAVEMSDKVPGTDGLTVAQCLTRGAYAYDTVVQSGPIWAAIRTLRGRITGNTDARAQYAYRSVIGGGSLERRVAALEKKEK